jgi:hypothetical protein
MSGKFRGSVETKGKPIVYSDSWGEEGDGEKDFSLFSALDTNIKESLDEIEMLRGTVQYWESRRPATDLGERATLAEAFRIIHGELLGLAARMKVLIDR